MWGCRTCKLHQTKEAAQTAVVVTAAAWVRWLGEFDKSVGSEGATGLRTVVARELPLNQECTEPRRRKRQWWRVLARLTG